jgi:Na+/H+ antiporter NhaD/arsenite permease-like protein
MCVNTIGGYPTGHLISCVLIKEYIPFIVLIGTLYIIGTGIHIRINKEGSTNVNIAILVFGEFLSNFIGTTGTSMLLLKPMIDVNKNRKYKIHTMIFFIFLVSNIGGCLLPFGDPPLFLGYLKGVDFFWTATHIFPLFFIVSACLLAIYVCIDKYFVRLEKDQLAKEVEHKAHGMCKLNNNAIQITGHLNIILMVFVTLLVAYTGIMPKKKAFSIFGTAVHYKGLIRDIGLVVISAISLWMRKYVTRTVSKTSFAPISEVARYFVAIFMTMAPVAVMLKHGHEFFQPIRNLLANTQHASFWYFWFVSPFSSFLDNAPTYLVFFKMAGGDAINLMHEHPQILTAISASSVFMGAMTYIGNAPNFMVTSIAKQHGIRMPSFLGYMVWSCAILLPVLVAVSYFMMY